MFIILARSTFTKASKSVRKSTRIAAKISTNNSRNNRSRLTNGKSLILEPIYHRKSRSSHLTSTKKKSSKEKFAKTETVSSSKVKGRRVTRSKIKRQLKLQGSSSSKNAEISSFIIAEDSKRVSKLSKKYSKRHKSSSTSLNNLEGLRSQQKIAKSKVQEELGATTLREVEKDETYFSPRKIRSHCTDNGSTNRSKRRQSHNLNKKCVKAPPSSKVASSPQGNLSNSMWLFDEEDPFSFRE